MGLYHYSSSRRNVRLVSDIHDLIVYKKKNEKNNFCNIVTKMGLQYEASVTFLKKKTVDC